jgi:tetratricopeptide (TPR) repeat protein
VDRYRGNRQLVRARLSMRPSDCTARAGLDEAKALYEQILIASPRNFDALNLLGVIEAQQGNPRRAVELLDRAIAENGNHADACFNRGLALRSLGNLEAALAAFDRVVVLKPDHADAWWRRGMTLKDLGRPADSLASYDRAISIRPDHAESWAKRGIALYLLYEHDAAVKSFDKAIALDPQRGGEAYNNRGIVLQQLMQSDAAVDSYDRAIAVSPRYAEAHANRGIALQHLGRLAEAVKSYEAALTLRPDYAEAYSNLALALKELRQFDAAFSAWDKAVSIRPDFADAWWNKSLALLLHGDLKEGWALYEWRWRTPTFRRREFDRPLWLGKESIEGRTILLHSEQGFGDTLQFCRYARLVADRGARVIVEVSRPLLGLMQGLEGADVVMLRGTPLPEFDFHCPMLSLPLAMGTATGTASGSIPAAPSYLKADIGKMAEWAERLGPRTAPRVGLVWSGRATHKNDHNRSIMLADLLSRLPAGFDYVSLQKEVREADAASLAASPFRHFGNLISDFSDTAAMCELMDVVVSVDTSVAHLSGALGRPTWVMLPYTPDWRWLLDRDDSPWYPSMTLFRQGIDRSWLPVLDDVASRLLTLGNAPRQGRA